MGRPDTVEGVERFMRARLAGGPQEPLVRSSTGLHPFVTISRQAGAGGHSLAETLVQVFARQEDKALFGAWQVFDQRLCEIVAEDPRLKGSLDALLAEEVRSRADEVVTQLLRPTTDQSYVLDRVFRTVRMLAGVGKVIILGRGGSELTRGMGPGVSLRLVAPEPTRIERLVARDHCTERQARDDARRLDGNRARLLKRYFGVDIDDPLRYDAVFNTGLLPVDTVAEAVAAALRHRAAAVVP